MSVPWIPIHLSWTFFHFYCFNKLWTSWLGRPHGKRLDSWGTRCSITTLVSTPVVSHWVHGGPALGLGKETRRRVSLGLGTLRNTSGDVLVERSGRHDLEYCQEMGTSTRLLIRAQ